MILKTVACFLCIAQVGLAQVRVYQDDEVYDFYHDQSGEIVNLPSDDGLYSKIRLATFRAEIGLELEPLNDRALSVIGKMPRLEQLFIECFTAPITERTAELIASRESLRVVVLSHGRITPKAIPKLLSTPLQCLAIEGVPLSGQLHFLATKDLANLTLLHCGLTNKDAKAIPKSPKLRYLDLFGNEYLNKEFIKHLNLSNSLQEIHIGDIELDLEECRDVAKRFPSLRSLSAEIDPEGKAYLEAALTDFQLMPSYHWGGSPLSGLEEMRYRAPEKAEKN